MLKISFVQPNFRVGPSHLNSHFLPYSVGCIWAFAQSDSTIKNNICLDHIVFRRDKISDVATKLAKSNIVCFSHYIWNRNYNLTLAKLLKENNPTCKIIFGGPEVPISDKDIFKRYPFIDYVVVQEGELIFKDLLCSIVNDSPYPRGLLVNRESVVESTGKSPRIDCLDNLPSPYLVGVFDRLIAENPDVEWNATLETNRGCPYACTFCDWGSLTYSKVKNFNLEKVFAELEWIGKNRCGSVVIADANFGIFLDRDNAIADKLLEVQKTYGYPYIYTASWAKNQKQEVLEIVKKLSRKGLTLAVQSMDSNVLDLIKRKNLEQHKIREIFESCEKSNLPVDTELILGLPGESLDSFKNGIFELFNQGNHTGITIYQAQLLENAEMNLTQRNEFEIKSSTVFDYYAGSSPEEEITESIDIVIATKDIPFEDMIEAQIFSWFINTFHINGISNYIARFINKKQKVSYKDFYNDLFAFLKTRQWFDKEMQETRFHYSSWMKNGRVQHASVAGIVVNGTNIMHRTIMNIHEKELYNFIFNELKSFIDVYYPTHYTDDLIKLQYNYFIQFSEIASYPKTVVFENDIYGYLLFDSELDNTSTYKFLYTGDINLTLGTYLQKIHYDRRMNFGKAKIVKYST